MIDHKAGCGGMPCICRTVLYQPRDPYTGARLEERTLRDNNVAGLRQILIDIPDHYRVVVESEDAGTRDLTTVIINDSDMEVIL